MIIGVGAIGKRHLQSLIKLSGNANFYLIDPIFNSIKERKIESFLGVKSIRSNKKIFFYENIDDWIGKNTILDLCIIATNSDNRFSILKKILSSVIVKNIILEKFLFNKLSDYKKALKISSSKSNSIFVNQWILQSLKLRNIFDRFKNYKLDFKVTGIEWGMASNIVHFIDMVRYFKISKFNSPTIIKKNLSPVIRSAKRSGFYEVYGNLSIKYGKHNLYVNCEQGNYDVGSKPNSIDVEIRVRKYKNRFIKFNLKSGKIKGLENIDGKVRHFSKKIELMSQLTGNVFENLSKKKKIYLPNLKQSIKQHLVIYKLLSKHFKKVMKTKNGICPVT